MKTYDRLAPHYDLMYEGHYDAQQEQDVVWLDALFQTHGVTNVLDSSCGEGIHAVPLAQLGYRLTGSDLSRGMVRQARRRCVEYGVQFPLHTLDFCHLDHRFTTASFDAVLALGHSLSHVLDPQRARQALAQMQRVLTPGGLLVVDLPDFQQLEHLPSLSSARVPQAGGHTTLVLSERRVERTLVHFTLYRLERRGKRTRTNVYTVALRACSPQDFEAQLQDVGLTILQRQENWGQRGYLYTLHKERQ